MRLAAGVIVCFLIAPRGARAEPAAFDTRMREATERYRFGEWTFNAAQREIVGPEGLALPLSSGEFKLLMAFLERPKVALSREQLLDLTKGRDAEVFDRSIDNQVSRLRRKIEQDPKNPRYIKTVWGGGYMFTSDVENL